jgi:hypothetical protein
VTLLAASQKAWCGLVLRQARLAAYRASNSALLVNCS